jgi:hypothetical protein
MSVQTVPHLVWPPAQAHRPALQTNPGSHSLPHVPQLVAVVFRSTQLAPQGVKPV